VDAPLFYPGEFMAWELSWKGIQGGTTRLLVGEPGVVDGRPAIVVRSETRSAGLLAMFRHVRDDLITTLDLSTALPIRTEGTFEWGKPNKPVKNSRVVVQFHEGSYDIDYRRRGRKARSWLQKIPRGERVYDTHSVMGALRAWEPAEGTRAYFYAVSGRRLYRVQIAHAGTATIKTSLGRYSAVRIEGTATRLRRSLSPNKQRKPRQFTLWLSDDANRVPLRVEARTEYGAVKVELVDYERGEHAPVASR